MRKLGAAHRRRVVVATVVVLVASALGLAPPAAAATVSGTLELPDGDPATGLGAGVLLLPVAEDAFEEYGAPVDAGDGSFSITDVPPGDYELFGGVPGSTVYAASQAVNVTVAENGAVTVASNPRLQDATMSGTVVDPDGETPVGNGWVLLFDASGETFLGEAPVGGNGVWAFALPAADYRVIAESPVGGYVDSLPTAVTSPSTGNVVQLRAANVTGTVKEPLPSELGVGDVHIEVRDRATQMPVDGAFAFTGEDGQFGLLLPDGDYTLVAHPPPESGFAIGLLDVTVSNDGATVTPAPVTVRLRTPNVVGTILGPNGEEPGWGAWIQVIDTSTSPPAFVDGSGAGPDGSFLLSLAAGTYQLVAYPPRDNPGGWVHAELDITVEDDGDVVVGEQVVESIDLRFEQANVSGTIVTPGGAPAPYAEVEAQQDGMWVEGAWTTASGEGVFGLALDPGTYTLIARPGWDDDSGLAAGSLEITVGTDGTVTSPPGPIAISLAEPNLFGTVFASDETALFDAQVEVRDALGFPVENGWDHTDESGAYSLAVGNGTYQLMVRPPWWNSNAGAPTTVEVVVAGGVVTMVDGIPGSAPVDVTLADPNVTGTVNTPDGTAKVANAWLDVWNVTANQHESIWAQSDADGAWSLFLDDGTYDITAHPPWDNPDGYVQTSVRVVIEGNVVASVDGDTDATTVDIDLQGANVTGTVRQPAPSTAGVANASVNVMDQSGRWVDAWANTGSGGSFGLALDPGTYTVTAQPPWDANDAGWTSGSVEVVVGPDGSLSSVDGDAATTVEIRLQGANVTGRVFESDGTTAVTGTWVDVRDPDTWRTEPGANTSSDGTFNLRLDDGTWQLTAHPRWDDDSGNVAASVEVTVVGGNLASIGGSAVGAEDPVDISLRGANVQGTVESSPGVGANNVSIDVTDLATGQPVDGAWSWTQTRGGVTGSFSLSLPEGGYRLFARPGWELTGYGMGTADVTIDAGGNVTSPAGALVVTLPGANVRGTVLNGATGVADAFVFAQRADGRWVDGGNANANTDGEYSMTLPAGTYDLTAEPPWWSDDAVTRATVEDVVIDSNGDLVSVGGELVDSPDDPVDVPLGTPNVSGTVRNPAGTQSVAFANVEVFDSTGTWVTWTNSRSDGSFALELDDDTYRFVVRPPWNDTNGWAAVEVDVTVPTLGMLTIDLGTPNVTGTVTNPSGAGVRDAGVDIYNQTKEEWLGWTNTNASGDYGFYVDPADLADTFVITARPPWNGTAGWVQVSVERALDGDPDVDLQFSTGNISGSVRGAAGDGVLVADSFVQAERWNGTSWEWVDAWAVTRRDGSFSMNIAPGVADEFYRITAWPSWYNPAGYTQGTAHIVVESDGDIFEDDPQDADPATPWDGIIRLSTGTVSGTVTRADGTTPVANAIIDVRDAAGNALGYSATTDEDGSYHLNLPDATYKIRAMAPYLSGITDGTLVDMTVDIGDGAEDRDLRLGS